VTVRRITQSIFGALGLAAIAGGSWWVVVSQDCEELGCLAIVFGGYLIVLGAFILISLIPNRFGFFMLLITAGILTLAGMAAPFLFLVAAPLDVGLVLGWSKLRSYYLKESGIQHG